jgi:hypothetical protein
MTPQDVITEVRKLIQDESTPYRYDDATLLKYVNQTLKRICVLRPDLFCYIGEVGTVGDSVFQSCPADSARLVEVFRVKNGNSVTEVSRDMLDQSTPGWTAETSGTPVNYVRHVRNPNRFFLYPPPVAGTILILEYVQTPPVYTIDQTIQTLPDVYLPVVIDGTVYLVESVDNEHVNSGRAKLFYDSFTQALGVNMQNRAVTDTEEGGLDPKQVV